MSRAFLLLLLLAMTSCSEAERAMPGLQSVLENAIVELYALDPNPRVPGEPMKLLPTVQGYSTLGHFTLSRPERDAVVEILSDGLGKREPLSCFHPRHALVARNGGRTITVLISFECGQLQVHGDDGETRWALFQSTRRAVLDGMLIRHGVRVVTRRDDARAPS